MTEKQRIWAERVREWKASGKTLSEFAKGRPYNAGTLAWWRSELRRRGLLDKAGQKPRFTNAATNTPQVRMARVVRRASPTSVRASNSGVSVEIDGARVMVEREFDPSVLGSVVRTLREAR